MSTPRPLRTVRTKTSSCASCGGRPGSPPAVSRRTRVATSILRAPCAPRPAPTPSPRTRPHAADAYARLGTFREAAAMLEVSLEALRGPKRAEAQKRLGLLKQDKLDDPAGAYLLFEAVVAFDPGDDEIRRRYGELARKLGKELDAARLLSRAATG